MTIGDDFKILSDKTTDGVRHITAVPSAIVCSAQIDFDLIEGKIHNLRYIKGCDGNLQAIGRLPARLYCVDSILTPIPLLLHHGEERGWWTCHLPPGKNRPFRKTILYL